MSDPRTIEITVSESCRCSQRRAFEVLRDWRRFPEWWPVSVSPRPGDQRGVVVRPLPLVSIVMAPAAEVAPREVKFLYVGGPFRGEGLWIIDPQADDRCTVQYSVRLRPANRLVAWFAGTPAFRFKHRRDIRAIVERLATVATSRCQPILSETANP